MLDRERLILFFKSPELGRVKTRLSSDLNESTTLEVYKSLVETNLNLAKYWKNEAPQTRTITPYGTGDRFLWNKLGLNHAKHQYGHDLGQRMEHALREELKFAKKAMIIGTDTPNLNLDVLNSAFNSLDNHDAVLGPSVDGGYYLIGMNKVIPGLLYNLSWSSENTFSKTMERMLNLSLKVYGSLPVYNDIDTFEDLKSLNYRPDLWKQQK